MQTLRRALWWLLTAPFRLIFWLISLPFRFLGWLFRPVVTRYKNSRFYVFMTEVPDDRPAMDAISDAIQDPNGILAELEAVRHHLLRALLVVIISVVASFWYTSDLIAFLSIPVGGLDKLQVIQVTESISIFMRVAVIAGLALASPYIAFEIWLFAAPGLMPRARQIGLLSIPLATLFFVGGMAFTYYFMFPVAIPFLQQGFLQVQSNWTADSYIKFTSGLLFWIGLSFEFPLVIFALSAMGVLEPKILLKQWRLAVVIIAFVAAAITPTVDMGTMALTMAPMIGLYFLSILFSYIARATSGKDQPTAQAQQP
jgi:sec-independent protein translocase protein TatC